MDWMGWMGEAIRRFFFPLLQTYVYICIAGVGVRGYGTGTGYGIIVPFHLYTPSPLKPAVVKLDRIGLDWIV